MSERKEIPIDGVFDIETANWDQFLCGAILLSTGETYVQDWEGEDALIDRLLAQEKGTFWAHNGGRYDALWLLSHLQRRGIDAEVFCAGGAITCLKIGEIEIRDSARLVPMALEEAAQIGLYAKSPTGFSCSCGESCGGYCAFSRDMPRADLRKVIDYLQDDIRATLSMLEELQTYSSQHDLDLAGTIGNSAWRTAARLAQAPKAKWKRASHYNMARAGRYGGRTQVFRSLADHGHRYDITSAYPDALGRTELPVGEYKILSDVEAKRAYANGVEGIYEAEVIVPEMHIPPLPWRTKDRIAYPLGVFMGSWTKPELVYAESLGVRIRRFGSAIVWRMTERIMKPFVDHVWALRQKVIQEKGKKHALAKWLKLYANSQTGKLAQRPEGEAIHINPSQTKIRRCKPKSCGDGFLHGIMKDRCCVHRCTGTCNAWTPIDLDSTVWSAPTYRIPECGHVHWNAYLTTGTRIELHQELTADGDDGESAAYCDTDSCYATVPRSRRLGKNLGEWDYEGSFTDFEALAPKTYAYRDEKGKLVARAKGIPNAEKHWDRIRRGEPIDIKRGVKTFLSAVRSGEGLFSRKEFSRHVETNQTSMGDRILDGVITRPQFADVFQHVP